MKILLIEDEVALSDAICQSLKKQNYSATAMYDGESGLYEALTDGYDAVILDVMLPKLNGFEVLKKLRAEKLSTPILMLTAKSETESKVTGLDLGADYYLTKPFEMRELMACIRAITRRPESIKNNNLEYIDLELKTAQGGVYCKSTGQFIKMGLKELHLLEILMNNHGHIVPKDTLIERIWGLENDSEYNNIEVYVSFVRKKLSFIGSKVTIKSTRGIGYSLEEIND